MMHVLAAVDVFTVGNNFIVGLIGILKGVAVVLAILLVLSTLRSEQGSPSKVVGAILIGVLVVFFVGNPDPFLHIVDATLRALGAD